MDRKYNFECTYLLKYKFLGYYLQNYIRMIIFDLNMSTKQERSSNIVLD